MENNQTIGAKIVALRKAKGLTQADLGVYLNISYQAVSKWERDESCPDFSTLSKIAQFFNVPISHFEDASDEVATTAVAAPVPAQKEGEVMLGVCKDCGKVVYEGEEGLTAPVLVCKQCMARRKRLAEQKELNEKKERERREREALEREARRKEDIKKSRNKGLIWGIIFAVVTLIGSLSMSMGLLCIPMTILTFTWGSQMFWDGFVYDATLFGGKVLGTPGVIWEFSWDGFMFLIGVKIFFAILRMVIWCFTFFASAVFAWLISPFTFFFALKRVNEGDLI